MSFISKFFGWFKGLAGSPKADQLLRDIQKAALAALPIVKMIAELTPSRADDVLVALFVKYAVPNVEAFLALPMGNRGAALLEVATTELSRKLPDVAKSILQTGIQLAVVQMNANNKP